MRAPDLEGFGPGGTNGSRIDVLGLLGDLTSGRRSVALSDLEAARDAVAEMVDLLSAYQRTNAMESELGRELFGDTAELLARIGGAA